MHAEVRDGEMGSVLAIAVVVALAIHGVCRPHAVDLDPVGLGGRRLLGQRFLGLPGESICEWGGTVECMPYMPCMRDACSRAERTFLALVDARW